MWDTFQLHTNCICVRRCVGWCWRWLVSLPIIDWCWRLQSLVFRWSLLDDAENGHCLLAVNWWFNVDNYHCPSFDDRNSHLTSARLLRLGIMWCLYLLLLFDLFKALCCSFSDTNACYHYGLIFFVFRHRSSISHDHCLPTFSRSSQEVTLMVHAL